MDYLRQCWCWQVSNNESLIVLTYFLNIEKLITLEK